jgi:hypothetical protein
MAAQRPQPCGWSMMGMLPCELHGPGVKARSRYRGAGSTTRYCTCVDLPACASEGMPVFRLLLVEGGALNAENLKGRIERPAEDEVGHVALDDVELSLGDRPCREAADLRHDH